MKTLKIKIIGTVQGMLFRKFIKETADAIRVRGYVRNLDDGNVEIVVEGIDEKVHEFVNKCKNGPKHSDIREVEVEEIKHQGFEGFKIFRL